MIPAVVIMAVLGLAAGIALALAARYFKAPADARTDEIYALLSGANCGGCGYPGCAALARAIAAGEAPANACPAATDEAVARIAAVTGLAVPSARSLTARLRCGGGVNCSDRYVYYGPADCYAMSALTGGPKECFYGCLGGGTCAEACPFGAIVMGGEKLPVISAAECTGCGVCVEVCPRNVIFLDHTSRNVVVACASRDKGPETKKICSRGCIGCRICEKICPVDAVAVSDFLAVIDGEKCVRCGQCVKKCPTSAIRVEDGRPFRR